MSRDIIAIGDVHGDGERLFSAMTRLGLISKSGVWTGGSTNLVILGDVVDGLPRTDQYFVSMMGDVAALEFLDEIAKQAERVGGAVTRLLGNHEHFALAGVHNYVHPADMSRAGGDEQRHRLFQPGGKAFKALAAWKYVHVENRTVFCHAGISTVAAAKLRDVDAVRNAEDHVTLPHILEHRQYAEDSGDPDAIATLRAMLTRAGCRSMVIGHNTVQVPVTIWDGLVTLADCGLSRAFRAPGHMYAICVRPNGTQETIVIRSSPDAA